MMQKCVYSVCLFTSFCGAESQADYMKRTPYKRLWLPVAAFKNRYGKGKCFVIGKCKKESFAFAQTRTALPACRGWDNYDRFF